MYQCEREKYTIPLCDIINQIWIEDHENESQNSLTDWRDALETINERIEYSGPIIFGDEWECYGDEDDRLDLIKHIVNDYYTRNICCDSVMRWVMFIRNKMHDIMPKYKALYNAQMRLIAEDPLSPYHIEETKHLTSNLNKDRMDKSITKDNTSIENESNISSVTNNNGTDVTDTKNVTKSSNTPQALASAIESGDDIPLNYLSTMSVIDEKADNTYNDVTDSTDSSYSKSHTNGNNEYMNEGNDSENKLEDYIKEIKGNILKFNNGQLIRDYQNAILTIEQDISKELADLFFQLY